MLAREFGSKIYQLSHLSELIRNDIVLPFAGNLVQDKAPIGGNFDPMFGDLEQAQAYITSVEAGTNLYRSLDVITPFYSAYIASVPSIDPKKVSWKDIMSIRRNEAIFEEWRTLVHDILDDLYNKSDRFSDIPGEFEATAKEKIRAWGEKLAVQRMRSTALDAIWGGAKQISLGWVAGALALAAFGSELTMAAAAVGAAKGLGKPILSMITEAARALSEREARVSLEHHILALG
jgi:hypothetical protein